MKIVVVHYGDSTVVERVTNALKERKVSHSICRRAELCDSLFDSVDFVITIGGDGTFLRTSHFISDTPILGINSDPGKKEGFLLLANIHNFSNFLDSFLADKYKIVELSRLYCKVNGKTTKDLALNDYYVGPKEPYKLYNYELKVEKNYEFQRSSGILTATAVGSTAWVHSAGGTKRNKMERKLQYLVREPYLGNLLKGYNYLKGNTTRPIFVKQISATGIVVADSVSEEYLLKTGDIVEIGLSKHPLRCVSV